jgi:hypothetical protein
MKNWIKTRQAYDWVRMAGLLMMIVSVIVGPSSDSEGWHVAFLVSVTVYIFGMWMETDYLRKVIRSMEKAA